MILYAIESRVQIFSISKENVILLFFLLIILSFINKVEELLFTILHPFSSAQSMCEELMSKVKARAERSVI